MYVEALNDARTKRTEIFSILPGEGLSRCQS